MKNPCKEILLPQSFSLKLDTVLTVRCHVCLKYTCRYLDDFGFSRYYCRNCDGRKQNI